MIREVSGLLEDVVELGHGCIEIYGRTLDCQFCARGSHTFFEIGRSGKVLCEACINGLVESFWHRYGGFPSFKHPIPYPERKVNATLRRKVFERDAYRCRYCGDHRNLVLDHVEPFARGGACSLENLVTACRPCNVAKGARNPEEAGLVLRPVMEKEQDNGTY
jgi:5-methylcytosine-specific restriction endonuclease McrA